ncbi:MAG: cytochrome c [Bacteroidia bacterium]
MDTGILHTHHLLGVLLLLLVGVPVVFPKWSQKVRWAHAVLDSLLLLTGIYLLVRAPQAFAPTYLGKYALVILAIGLAILGQRRANKRLSIAAFFVLIYAYGLSLQRDWLLRSEADRVATWQAAEPSEALGQALYVQLCQRCHGPDGRAHYRKSPSLHPIQNPDTTYWIAVIRAGKGVMPAHPYLSDTQLQSLILFLHTWQK